jgi:NAD+ synthase (glutamine-hydrolysing)
VSGSGDGQLTRDLAEAHLAALAREVAGIVLSSDDKTALALEAPRVSTSAARFAPLGDVYRIDVLDIARMRNTVSAVFPSLQVLVSDVPDVGIPVNAWEAEVLLEQIDALVAAYVEGMRGLTELASMSGDEELATCVAHALREHEAFRAAGPPVLMMSTRTLQDARTLLGFAWRDRVRKEGEPWSDFLLSAIRSGSGGQNKDEAAERPPESSFGRKDLADALALLRDFAQNAEGEWFSPFSDN